MRLTKKEDKANEMAAISALTKRALQDITRQSKSKVYLNHLINHYIFGARDLQTEKAKTDRLVGQLFLKKTTRTQINYYLR
jgi:hypothetical protein